jgi:hypothetical protein
MGLEVIVTAALSLFGQLLRLSLFGLLALAGYHHDAITRAFQEAVHTIRCMIIVCRYLAPRINATTSTTASLAEEISRSALMISADAASDSVASAPDAASEVCVHPGDVAKRLDSGLTLLVPGSEAVCIGSCSPSLLGRASKGSAAGQ